MQTEKFIKRIDLRLSVLTTKRRGQRKLLEVMSVIDLVGLVNMAGGKAGTTGCSFWIRSLQLYYTGKGSPPACCKDLACPRSLGEKVGVGSERPLPM